MIKLKITRITGKDKYGTSIVFLLIGSFFFYSAFFSPLVENFITRFGLIILGMMFLYGSYKVFKDVGKEYDEEIECEGYEVI